jgi:hypothetical protein
MSSSINAHLKHYWFHLRVDRGRGGGGRASNGIDVCNHFTGLAFFAPPI